MHILIVQDKLFVFHIPLRFHYIICIYIFLYLVQFGSRHPYFFFCIQTHFKIDTKLKDQKQMENPLFLNKVTHFNYVLGAFLWSLTVSHTSRLYSF